MPVLFVVSEISKLLALVNYKSIFVIESHDHKVVATLPSGRNPVMLVASPDCKALYLIDRDKDSGKCVLYKIDVDNKKIASSITLEGLPGSMQVRPDGRLIYLSMASEGRIVAIDTNTLSIEANILVQNADRRMYWPGGNGHQSRR